MTVQQQKEAATASDADAIVTVCDINDDSDEEEEYNNGICTSFVVPFRIISCMSIYYIS